MRSWISLLFFLVPCGIQSDPRPEELQGLIQKLGSESIEEREAAARKLVGLGKSARKSVVEATASKNVEIARRALTILEALDSNVECTLEYVHRALQEERDSLPKLLRRLQLWSTRVFEGKNWQDIPEVLERQGIVFESLRDFEERNLTTFHYLLKRNGLEVVQGVYLNARISFDVRRTVKGTVKTTFEIESVRMSLGFELGDDYATLVERLKNLKGSVFQMALAEERFDEVSGEFPVVRSVALTYGPLYRIRQSDYESGIELHCELGSVGRIRSSSYECGLVSGLDPVRNGKGEAIDPSFLPVDTLHVQRASGGGSSGPIGHGLKRLDRSPVRDPFYWPGQSKRHNRWVYSIPDFEALSPSALRVRVKLSTCSAKDLRELLRLKSLSFLDLSDCTIDDEAVQVVASLRSLDELWLSAKNLTDDGVKSLSSLVNLRHLYVEEAPNLTNQALTILGSFPRLGTLALSGWKKLTDDGMKHVAAQAGLTRLDFSSLPLLTDAGIERLTGLRRLQEFELNWQEGLSRRTASALAQFPELRDIWFTSCGVDDSWMPELGKIKSLQFLMAHQCRGITDAGLLALKDLQDLRRLNVDNQATEAGMKALKVLLPGEYVSY